MPPLPPCWRTVAIDVLRWRRDVHGWSGGVPVKWIIVIHRHADKEAIFLMPPVHDFSPRGEDAHEFSDEESAHAMAKVIATYTGETTEVRKVIEGSHYKKGQ